MASEKRIEDGDISQLAPRTETLQLLQPFGPFWTAALRLGPRSITSGFSKEEFVDKHINAVRKLVSLDSLLEGREYWFFQLRDSFLKQERVMEWDPNDLDQYAVLPIDYGFVVNNKDCFFVSHFWRERTHPDPDGTDMRLIHEDLKDPDWSNRLDVHASSPPDRRRAILFRQNAPLNFNARARLWL